MGRLRGAAGTALAVALLIASSGCAFIPRAEVVLHGAGEVGCIYAGVFPCTPFVVIRPAGAEGSLAPEPTDPHFTASAPDEDGVQIVEGHVRNSPAPIAVGKYLVAGAMASPNDTMPVEGQPTPDRWAQLFVGCEAAFDVTASTARVEISVTYRADGTCDVLVEVVDQETGSEPPPAR